MQETEPSKTSAHPSDSISARLSRICGLREFCVLGLAGAAAMTLGGCSQQTVSQISSRSKEYFSSSVYGRPSPRVVAFGEPVPRGGGVYMVGKPYSVAGRMYFPTEKQRTTIGLASWYGEAFHGRRTANGEVYDCEAITAAHPTMPLPSYARVTNLENRHSLIVRVNDRGPFHDDRVLDVSRKTAEILDFRGLGTTRVKVEYMGPASVEGSDDMKLLATLRTNGPAVFAIKDRTPLLELASSAPPHTPADRTDSRTAESGGTPTPPTKGIGAGRPGEVERARVAAIASAAPFPPARPSDVKGRPQSGASKATRIARAGDDKSTAGH